METVQQYGVSLPLWCKRLRQEWGSDDFHLLAVMLPKFGRVLRGGKSSDANSPDAYSWTHFREQQMCLLDLPYTGIANSIDLGDPRNIHPKDKAPIGERLSRLAARDVNQKETQAEGPTFERMVVVGRTLHVRFTHAEGLKTTDGDAPREFWISGKYGAWHRATAVIRENRVALTAEGVTRPLYVRYAFTGAPDVNLINDAGLPALPFRTDTD